MAKMLGYTPEEMAGKHLFNFMDDEAIKSAQKYLKRRSDGIIETHTFIFTHKSGEKIYTKINTYPFLDDSKKYHGALAAITNITEQKKLEETYKKLDTKFKSIFEFLSIGLGIINKDFIITDANKRLVELLNCSKEDLIYKDLFTFISAKHKAQLSSQLSGLINGSKATFMGEYDVSFNDTSIKNAFMNFFSFKVTPDSYDSEIIFSIIDTNSNKNFEYKLLKNEALIKGALEHSKSAILILDRDLKILYANEKVKSQFGRYYNIVPTGLHLKEIVNLYNLTEYYEKWEKRIYECFEDRVAKYYSEKALINGKPMFSEIILNPIKDINNNVFAVTFIFKDITERKINELEMQEKEKFASLGKMVSLISHEIKSPLAAIDINLNLIKEELDLSDKKLRSFSIIESEIKRLGTFLNDLLRFSSDFRLDKTYFDIKNIIQQVFKLFELNLKEKNIKLINRVKSQLLYGDLDKIKGVLIDLIKNAIEAIQKEGKIELYTSKDIMNGFFNLFIKDSGHGVEEPEKIFGVFYTTKENGSGLGLSIAKNIIEKHGGSIILVSSKPQETIFQIKLPIYEKT